MLAISTMPRNEPEIEGTCDFGERASVWRSALVPVR
jgi:hypothetical protein